MVRLGWLGLAAVASAKLAAEGAILRHLADRGLTPLKRSALLIRGALGRVAVARLALGIAGGIALPVTIATSARWMPAVALGASAILSAVLLVGGELLERFLFFAAATRPRMPGGGHSA